MGKGAGEAIAGKSEAHWRREPRWWCRAAEGGEGKGRGDNGMRGEKERRQWVLGTGE